MNEKKEGMVIGKLYGIEEREGGTNAKGEEVLTNQKPNSEQRNSSGGMGENRAEYSTLKFHLGSS